MQATKRQMDNISEIIVEKDNCHSILGAIPGEGIRYALHGVYVAHGCKWRLATRGPTILLGFRDEWF